MIHLFSIQVSKKTVSPKSLTFHKDKKVTDTNKTKVSIFSTNAADMRMKKYIKSVLIYFSCSLFRIQETVFIQKEDLFIQEVQSSFTNLLEKILVLEVL